MNDKIKRCREVIEALVKQEKQEFREMTELQGGNYELQVEKV